MSTQLAFTPASDTREVAPLGLIQAAIQSAIQSGKGLEVIDVLMRQQREMIEYNAKVAFDNAMQQAQGKVKRVGFDSKNPQTGSQYVTYAKLDKALRPIYSDEGFALSFDTAEIEKPDTVRVVCYVSHTAGHTRTYHIDMPADGKGAKGGDVMTRTHATGSAVSYGKRYLLGMIFNVTVGEKDDDGNAASGQSMSKSLSDADHLTHITHIENAANKGELNRLYIQAIKAAGAIGDQASLAAFEAAANKRIKEL